MSGRTFVVEVDSLIPLETEEIHAALVVGLQRPCGRRGVGYSLRVRTLEDHEAER